MSNERLSIRAVRSDGEIFDYESDTLKGWHLIKIEGLDFPNLEIFTEDRGFGNGSIITGKRKEARNITLKSRCSFTSKAERERVIGFHNNNYSFDLYINYMGILRIAKGCELKNSKCPTENIYAPLNLTVGYLHPESDLISNETTNVGFYNVDPMWHVTRAYAPDGGSLVFGVISQAVTKYIDYSGSENTYITAILTMQESVIGINITVNNKTLSVNHTFSAGDILVIDSEWKQVELNGMEMSPNDYNGEMLPELILTFGDNDISIVDDSGDNSGFNTELNYTGRYGGL